ncbi:hypothetical protein [Actinokineospora globicatena]|uniref:hypothetical protein n=1 Tax=Actinokineospora globicatena TaxID=103729 RepID=UPI0020A61A68|nr:hypothetical protein [Actinokineospora globicatena]MCP2302747.1 hypothetical protein [Actinokineospora globicatena]GLW75563.1 hypothetical protein Aglo01_00450 [Actinokineospora globicatena]GLW82403.1 hypothetical protein Aglo02_00440 [Actinokineospora globicatena]
MTRNPDIDVYATIRPGTEITCDVTKSEVQLRFGGHADGFHLIIEAGALSRFVDSMQGALDSLQNAA